MKRKQWLSSSVAAALLLAGTLPASAATTTGAKKEASNKMVRLIVELKSSPAVTYASKMHKRFSELTATKQKELQATALKQQAKVKDLIDERELDVQYEESFTNVLNGFSVELPATQVAQIKRLPNVKSVHVATEYFLPKTTAVTPQMAQSKEMLQAEKVWNDYKVKGEGMVVAVIDSGIDPTHKDLVLSKETKPALSKSAVESIIAKKKLKGTYFTDKIPYGYNYFDDNTMVLDTRDEDSHGLHVSGTVAGNGDEKAGGIKGVAPEAQILAMKVFSNDPGYGSTFSDIYVKAIDDAIALGADVVNMSLGSTAAFVQPNSPEEKAINNAVNNGVFFSISAGNSGLSTYGFKDNTPTSAMPDVGTVGSPSLFAKPISVANLQKDKIEAAALEFTIGDAKKSLAYFSSSTVDPATLQQKEFAVVEAGKGKPEDFKGKDVKGKFVLIQRGEITFIEKTVNAQENGAAGVIIYNDNRSDGFIGGMASDPEKVKIPQLDILPREADKIVADIKNGKATKVKFAGEKIVIANPEAGHFNESSSWGVTPSLELKPEITAPGTSILSLKNDNQYVSMTGTSMASPHIAGGAALVMEQLKKTNKKDGNLVQLTKNIMMNTATVLKDKGATNAQYDGDAYYSPRLQGAGVLNLPAALSAQAVLADAKTNEAKVSLKEIGDETTFTLKVKNLADKEVIYNVGGTVQTDLVLEGKMKFESQSVYSKATLDEKSGKGQYPIAFTSKALNDKKQLVVPAKGEVTVDVTVNLKDAIDWANNASLKELFPNGNFIEGFVTLTDATDATPALHLPYTGFYGDWSKQSIFDDVKDSETSFFNQAGLVTANVEKEKDEAGEEHSVYEYLGYNAATEKVNGKAMAFSPNEDGTKDEVVPLISLVRNAKQYEVNVLDANDKKLVKLSSEIDVPRHFADGGRTPLTTFVEDALWDGTVSGRAVKDGLYYIQLRGKIDYATAKWQEKKYPVYVDTKAPTLTAKVNSGEVTWTATDETSGVAYYDVLIDGKSALKTKLDDKTTSYKLASDVKSTAVVTVVAYDYAGNPAFATVQGKTTGPVVKLETPKGMDTKGQRYFELAGTVSSAAEVKEFTINDIPVDVVWNEAEGKYFFSTTFVFDKDQIAHVKVEAKDALGNVAKFGRYVFVDGSPAQLAVKAPKFVAASEATAQLKIEATENFPELTVYVDNEELFKQRMVEPYALKTVKKSLTKTVTLKKGKNTFVVTARNIAGEFTTKTINIYRGDYKLPIMKDIAKSAAKAEIEFIARQKLIDINKGLVRPTAALTRAEAAAFLVRAADYDASDSEANIVDVADSSPYYNEINFVVENGLLAAPKGKFNPNAPITRGELALLFVKLFNLEADYDAKFSDIEKGSALELYANSVAAHDIYYGKANHVFGAKEKVTRAEFALWLARALDEGFRLK